MIKAVIFDMDGTLVKTEPLWLKSSNFALKKYGIRISKAQYCNWTGKDELEKFRIALSPLGKESDSENVVLERRKFFLSLLKSSKIKANPFLVNAIKFFRNKGLKLALATSTRTEIVEKVLEKTGISEFFEIMVTSNEVASKKPDPEIYLLAAKKLGVKPEDCIAFEDSHSGVSSAKRAGMKCVAVPHSYSECQDFSEADFIVRDRKKINKKFLERCMK
ncbi:MAG: HAD family phosphatase [Candidatus Woesearchaeota archaeon]|nr:HAD family phosphatase [Candidatus Woesearchaeota archaeon]